MIYWYWLNNFWMKATVGSTVLPCCHQLNETIHIGVVKDCLSTWSEGPTIYYLAAYIIMRGSEANSDAAITHLRSEHRDNRCSDIRSYDWEIRFVWRRCSSCSHWFQCVFWSLLEMLLSAFIQRMSDFLSFHTFWKSADLWRRFVLRWDDHVQSLCANVHEIDRDCSANNNEIRFLSASISTKLCHKRLIEFENVSQ